MCYVLIISKILTKVNFHEVKILSRLFSFSAIPVHLFIELVRTNIHHYALSQGKMVLFMLTFSTSSCLLSHLCFWRYLCCVITSKSSIQDPSPKIWNCWPYSFMTEVPIIKTSTFICSGNFWISLYRIETSVMKELIRKTEYRLTNSLLLFRMFVSSQIPVDTRRRFNVYKTCIRCCWHLTEVGTTSCVYWSRSLSPWKYQKARVSLFSGVTKREFWIRVSTWIFTY